MPRISYLFFLFLALRFFACEEIPPTLNPGGGNNNGGNTPVEEQQRQVLIEEFTGVRCVNCPAGSDAIEALLNIHGEQLVAVGIHAGFFAVPYAESNENLATDAGAAILSFVGEPLGYPTAVVNRTQFDGEESLQLAQSQWAGYIAQELLTPPSVKIEILPDYNSDDRSLDVSTKLYVQETLTNPDIRLTVYITENNIEDAQLTPDGLQVDYNHKHVFRDVLTAVSGDVLGEAFTANTTIERDFTFTLPDHWVAEECHVVAFVHLGGGSKEVLQAHEEAVVE